MKAILIFIECFFALLTVAEDNAIAKTLYTIVTVVAMICTFGLLVAGR